MTSKYRFGYRYSKLEMKHWLKEYKLELLYLLCVYIVLLVAGVMHYKSEEKWYNSQITKWSNLQEDYKFINKNY